MSLRQISCLAALLASSAAPAMAQTCPEEEKGVIPPTQVIKEKPGLLMVGRDGDVVILWCNGYLQDIRDDKDTRRYIAEAIRRGMVKPAASDDEGV